MSKGVLLFAFNSPKYNYYQMAVATAKRVNHFLSLPVTLVTDNESLPEQQLYTFDNVVIAKADKTNKRDWGLWFNKGRYCAYQFSPYDETILLDADYMINSDTLLKTFELPTDFCCHDTTSFLMHPTATQEILSPYSFNTLWATVVTFKKTKRVEQIFNCLEMVQHNFEHYANIHGFIAPIFRNDYGLTIATRIVNGHVSLKEDVIPWNLLHIPPKDLSLHKNNDDQFNTEYTVLSNRWHKSKIRKEYTILKDTDFHVMNKENFMELISE